MGFGDHSVGYGVRFFAAVVCRDVMRWRASCAVIAAATMASTAPASASPDLMQVCTQRYTTWVDACDLTLRPHTPQTASTVSRDGEWCAPTPQAVSNLKTQLFSIDQSCEALAPEDKARMAALVGQTLRALSRVRACAAPTMAAVSPAPTGNPPAFVAKAAAPKPAVSEQPGLPKPVQKARVDVGPKLEAPVVTAALPSPSTARITDPPKTPTPPAGGSAAAPEKPALAKPIAEPRVGIPKKLESADAPKANPALANAPQEFRPLTTAAVPSKVIAQAPTRPVEPRAPHQEPRPAAVMVATPGAAAQAAPSQADPVSDPQDCLTVRQSDPGTYIIDASACRSQPIQAAVEFYRPNGVMDCVRQTIVRDVAVVGAEARAPEINFQCITGTAGCSAEILAEMFPECRQG